MDHIASYYEAERILSEGRNKNDRPVANNTRLIRRSDTTIALRLHGTDILTWDSSDHTVTVRTGGWETNTTRDRISDALGASIYFNGGVLCVTQAHDDEDTAMPIDGAVFQTLPYAGLTFLHHLKRQPVFDEAAAERRAMYLDRYDKALPIAAAFPTVADAARAKALKHPIAGWLPSDLDPACPSTRLALDTMLRAKFPLYKWS